MSRDSTDTMSGNIYVLYNIIFSITQFLSLLENFSSRFFPYFFLVISFFSPIVNFSNFVIFLPFFHPIETKKKRKNFVLKKRRKSNSKNRTVLEFTQNLHLLFFVFIFGQFFHFIDQNIGFAFLDFIVLFFETKMCFKKTNFEKTFFLCKNYKISLFQKVYLNK